MSIVPKPPRNGLRHQALIYTRVSREEAATGSHTLATQGTRVRETFDRLLGRGNYDAVEYRDDGLSGALGADPTAMERRTRKTLQTIRAEVLSGKWDYLGIYALNRLFRSPRQHHVFVEDVLLPSGTVLVSATEAIDLSSPAGRMTAGVMATVDGYFRDALIERTRDAALTTAQQGYLLGQPGYGWEWMPLVDVVPGARRGIRPVPAEGIWVGKMANWYLSGLSLPKIAARLNELGVPSPSGEKQWLAAVVDRTLKNPLHAGLVPSRQGPLPGQHAERRFYDAAVYEQLQQTRATRKRWARTNTARSTTHLLHGIVRCGRCGRRLFLAGSRGQPRAYQCLSGQGHGKLTCSGVWVKAELVDQAVESQLVRLAQEPGTRQLLLEAAASAAGEQDVQLRAEQTALRKTVDSVQERRDELMNALLRKTVDDARFREYEPKLLAEQHAAQQRLAAIEGELAGREQREAWAAEIRQRILQIPSVWSDLEMDERRAVVERVSEFLTLDRQGRVATLRFKICLLPVVEIAIPIPSVGSPKKEQTGVGSLTRRELAVLHWLDEGKTVEETAVEMGVTSATVRVWVSRIRRRMGTQVLDDIVAKARPRIKRLQASLPLHHLRSRQFEDAEAVSPSAELLEALQYFANGATMKEVAAETGLPLTTVAGRRALLLDTFRVKSVYQAFQKARELGIL